MAIKSINGNIFLIFGIFVFLGISGYINISTIKPRIEIKKQDSAINVNHQLLSIFSLGQKRLISDILWITTLMESDIEHYAKNDFQSWMYLRFKSIIELDPEFLSAYRFGGKYLTIVKDDLVGARKIFEAGLINYPNDYDLLFNYSFLLAFELFDYKAAVDSYSKLLKNPKSPPFIKTLILKLKYQSNGDLNSILPIIKELYENEPEDSFLKDRLRLDFYSIKSEIDLKCLNLFSKKDLNCNKKDLNGISYFIKEGSYTAPTKFSPYKLQKR